MKDQYTHCIEAQWFSALSNCIFNSKIVIINHLLSLTLAPKPEARIAFTRGPRGPLSSTLPESSV